MKLYKYYFLRLFLITVFIWSISSCHNDEAPNPNYIPDGEYDGTYFPTSDWKSCSPEDVGMNSGKLKNVHEFITADSINTNGLLVIKDGYVIYEEYFNGHNETSLHPSYSVAKSFTSAAIGIAIEKGLINSVSDSIYTYFPQIQSEDIQMEKKEITIKHLLTMTAGIEWNEEYFHNNSSNDLYMMTNSHDYIDYILTKPVINKPGTVAYYSSGESMLLSGIVENASGLDMESFMYQNLFSHIGITSLQWDQDPAGHTIGGWGINATLREFAKFGYLYLNKGRWDSNQLLSAAWIAESIDPVNSNIPNYGYQWWIGSGFTSYNNQNIPSDTFLGIGLFGQYLIVIPSENLIIVRTGFDRQDESKFLNTAELISLILNSAN